MVETVTIQGKDHFVTMASKEEENQLNNAQLEELFDVWQSYMDEYGERMLVLVPEWFSENEFNGGRRPYFFASVEHDDSSSGAILYSDAELVNISIVENQVLGDVTVTQSTEPLDISKTDDYIDEAGKVWIPRSLMTVFKFIG